MEAFEAHASKWQRRALVVHAATEDELLPKTDLPGKTEGSGRFIFV